MPVVMTLGMERHQSINRICRKGYCSQALLHFTVVISALPWGVQCFAVSCSKLTQAGQTNGDGFTGRKSCAAVHGAAKVCLSLPATIVSHVMVAL
jgi:hypothetical protein